MSHSFSSQHSAHVQCVCHVNSTPSECPFLWLCLLVKTLVLGMAWRIQANITMDMRAQGVSSHLQSLGKDA